MKTLKVQRKSVQHWTIERETLSDGSHVYNVAGSFALTTAIPTPESGKTPCVFYATDERHALSLQRTLEQCVGWQLR